ncbi:App1 family protein [Taibaiella koreensis]|uniref:App1 family protein n=1 Tax=Taibaiella koreensis TaxID=1268548 RepID=UPI000E59F953|nr:phosphatase domain-containing protein [Taibaiella koreensis]
MLRREAGPSIQRKAFIKVYQGFGHTGSLVVYGHVFHRKPYRFRRFRNSFLLNLVQLVRLFVLKPAPYVPLRLQFYDQVLEGHSEYDGFFRFEWASAHTLAAGWHPFTVGLGNDNPAPAEGKLWVPHVTQFAFISDIDDTIMKSYSATVFRRLYELLARNPERRRIFLETANHYKLLSLAHTHAAAPNPMFYVSSSEWNLYDYLDRVFSYNNLPPGIFLLNQVKRWFELLRSGKTGHSGKLIRISRVLQAFPRQQFVLLGDNSQQDPQLYRAIAEKHPGQIYAIYIRNVRASRAVATETLLSGLPANVHSCFFEHSSEAIEHGRAIGLLPQDKG